MNLEKVSSSLQIIANVGILGGLILVGLQLQQNSGILQAQMLSAESQSLINQELAIIGEEGAKAWVSAVSDPTNVSPEHHRIMESIYWNAIEGWRHTEELERLGLADVSPEFRARWEAPWYFGNTYGRAWWTVRSPDNLAISSDLKEIIDNAIMADPNFTSDQHEELIGEIRRLEEAE